MADVPATGPVSPAAPIAASAGNNTIVVETSVNNAPDKIQALARQIEVSGTMTQTPAGNTVTLNTVIGPLVLILPQLAQAQQDKLLQQLINLFQNQKPLTVVLQPGNPPTQAFLLLPPPTGGTASQSLPQVQTGTVPPRLLTPNITLSAVVLPNNIAFPVNADTTGKISYADAVLSSNAGILEEIENISPGLQTAKEVETLIGAETQAKLDVGTYPGFNPPQGNPIPVSAPIFANPSPPSFAAPTAPGIADPLQPGTELNLRIDAVIPPGTQPPQPSPNQILATVTGSGPGGQLLLKTADATLFVRQPYDAPPGTQLLITVDVQRPDAAAYLTLPPDPQEFTSLQQAIAAMMQIDPAAARAIIENHIPQPGDGMTGALLFFLSAVRQGDVRSWLGNGAVDLLTRAGKAELIGKLMQDLQETGQTVRDNMVGEWRSYPVPLHDNGQLSILHFYVHGGRKHHDKPGERNESGGTGPKQMRFLIDVRMSQLGAMQLDGFLKPKQLDIIVRSENALPPWLNEQLRGTYTRTLSALGYNGGLNFQSGRQGWLNMQKPAAGAAVVT